HRDVGAPEPVDRLLRVPDDEQRSLGDSDVFPVELSRASATRDPAGDLNLDGVGVLELVEEQPLVSALQGCPYLGIVPYQVSGQDEQVVELQPSLAAPRL